MTREPQFTDNKIGALIVCEEKVFGVEGTKGKEKD
jgi:hypothetical protein